MATLRLPMEFKDWEPLYLQILTDFGFDRVRDEEAAALLSDLLREKVDGTHSLGALLRGKEVTVLGNAIHLRKQLDKTRGIVIAADEALSVAREAAVRVDVLVTDLDGRVEDQVAANEEGTIAVIHAHGDNIEAVQQWVPAFHGPVVGTTQSKPLENVHNYGGFTDGDRAVFLAANFGGNPITLMGFDFERPSPKDQPREIKRRKLAWAKRLIELVGETVRVQHPSFSS